ncbi:TetR/AcrR family transcriptional regulator [Sporolactobacillus sp. KGMB 08714]|uniref:TetR/AcrR family transcriptional regulator n=1 Tax=Sporolactobacillus sp. KGMB 08714 TaxID=3064704 RepID=UPI002FBD6E02
MQPESTDRRAVKTREAIESKFLEMLLRKNFNEITVKDIAAGANVSRGTFYLHYVDKFDLLGRVMDGGLTALITHFHPENFFENSRLIPEKVVGFVTGIFGHFQKHELFFRAMLFNEGIPGFRSRVQKSFLQRFYSEVPGLISLHGTSDPVTFEIVPIFISSAMLGLVSWWFENDMSISKEEIARRLFLIMAKGPLRALGFVVDDGQEEG